MMDRPFTPVHEKTGIILRVNKPDLGDFSSRRITYNILVGDTVLHDQLYECFTEVDS